MNEFLATGPFDLYELQLFHLVAEHQSFTKAGRAAGLTQSAITRQIGGMEERLGVRLFERTTRSVRLTPAGAALHARSGAILTEVDDAVRALRSDFELAPRTLRVGITRTIGLAYLPADSFDFIVNLVSLGMGMSVVPHRVLALHPNRRPVQRITTNPKFCRDVIVVVRRQPQLPQALAGFVENILF